MSENRKKTNARVIRLRTFLGLLSPANFALTFSYLRKHGVRVCFARTVSIVSLALGVRRSAKSVARQPLAHKARHGRAPMKRKLPDGPPPLDGGQDALRLELATIKDSLADILQRAKKIDE
jgi:hypothetical protein